MSVASKIKRSISSWKGVQAFKALPLSKRKIVFYVEDGGYWNYFKDIYTALQNNFNQNHIGIDINGQLGTKIYSPNQRWR